MKLAGKSHTRTYRTANPHTAVIAPPFPTFLAFLAARAAKQRTNDEQQARGRKAETGTWEEPDWALLDDRRGELPDFPVEALPASLRGWLLRAARGAGVTPGHVAVPLLGIASSLIGTARRVRACRSWSEPLTMWVALIGFSGTGKTPGLDVTRRVLSLIERGRKQKIAELQREHETRAQKAKAERKKWEKAVAEAVEANLPAPPKPASASEPGSVRSAETVLYRTARLSELPFYWKQDRRAWRSSPMSSRACF